MAHKSLCQFHNIKTWSMLFLQVLWESLPFKLCRNYQHIRATSTLPAVAVPRTGERSEIEMTALFSTFTGTHIHIWKLGLQWENRYAFDNSTFGRTPKSQRKTSGIWYNICVAIDIGRCAGLRKQQHLKATASGWHRCLTPLAILSKQLQWWIVTSL